MASDADEALWLVSVTHDVVWDVHSATAVVGELFRDQDLRRGSVFFGFLRSGQPFAKLW